MTTSAAAPVLFLASNVLEITKLVHERCPPTIKPVSAVNLASCRSVASPELIRAAIVFGVPVTSELLGSLPNLELIHLLSAGSDGVDLELLEQRGVRICDNAGANSGAVADQALLLMLGLLRNVLEADRNVRSGRWHQGAMEVERLSQLEGKTVGIVGLGRIGKKVAARLMGFDATVIFHDIRPIDLGALSGSVRKVSFEELLEKSDVVTAHVPLTAATRKMFNTRAFSQMKHGSTFVNTCRGAVLDTDALVHALESGRLRGAGMDVFDQEPNVDSRLIESSKVILTPHRAGSSLENWWIRLDEAFDNVNRFLLGQPVVSQITSVP